ncbi:unnamed protein product [Trichobilharzia regenti]|nr:unnamed protein product [Trichobilharzia regenti]
MEAPAGVGFSYAVDNNITTDDDFTALNNYHALLNFLKIYPEYTHRDLFLTGESYAGVYLPTLALHIIKSSQFNLKLAVHLILVDSDEHSTEYLNKFALRAFGIL